MLHRPFVMHCWEASRPLLTGSSAWHLTGSLHLEPDRHLHTNILKSWQAPLLPKCVQGLLTLRCAHFSKAYSCLQVWVFEQSLACDNASLVFRYRQMMVHPIRSGIWKKRLRSVWSKFFFTQPIIHSSDPTGFVSTFKTLDLVADKSSTVNLT